MPTNRITNYFRPVNTPGPSAEAPAPASASASTSASRPARTGTLPPELQARAPRPYATDTLNRAHARVDLGSKFAAFSQRMRDEQALPHEAGPSVPAAPPAGTREPDAPAQPLYVLSHLTQPTAAPAAETPPAAPAQPHYVLTHLPQATAAPSPQPHGPQPPLFYLNHNPQPGYMGTYQPMFGPNSRNTFFTGRMFDMLARLPSRLLPRLRQRGEPAHPALPPPQPHQPHRRDDPGA